MLYGLSGQAIGPGRFLVAVIRHVSSPKHLACPEHPDGHGLVLDAAPPETLVPTAAQLDPELQEALR